VDGVTHLVLTRFNVRWIIGPHDTDWLAHRFELFDRFCYPSVQGQTTHDFRWLVFFDEDTPEPFRSRIGAYARWPVFTPIFIGRPSSAVYDAAIAAHVGDADHLVTTRLDNDDALGRDFVHRVQASVRPGEREFLNLPIGCIWRKGRLYRHEHRSNAFISLAEPAAGHLTVWSNRHEDAADVAPVRQLAGGTAWLQVVHERNVANRVRGHRVAAARVRSEFSLDLGDVAANETAADYWIDRRVRHPARVVRDNTFRVAKPVRDLVERATTAVRER
jgi:hypothetical protein